MQKDLPSHREGVSAAQTDPLAAAGWAAAMVAAGTRGSLNTAFVERMNLTLRQGLAALTRRSAAIAKTKRHRVAFRRRLGIQDMRL